jgi:hypothetical protein
VRAGAGVAAGVMGRGRGEVFRGLRGLRDLRDLRGSRVGLTRGAVMPVAMGMVRKEGRGLIGAMEWKSGCWRQGR